MYGKKRSAFGRFAIFSISFVVLIAIQLVRSAPNTIRSITEDATNTAIRNANNQLTSTEAPSGKNDTDCVPRSIENFPKDLFTQEQRLNGAVVLHLIAALYMFLGLAILCEDYFVPCLESISEALHLQPDVAGATFMAAGSSAPELATTVIGVFVAETDIGLGSVVGSADYNLMFVIAACALAAKTEIQLNWWPLVRDCVYYCISIALLAIVIFDGEIAWYEAVVFIVAYILYVILMYFNPKMENYFVGLLDRKFGWAPHLKKYSQPLSDSEENVEHNELEVRESDTESIKRSHKSEKEDEKRLILKDGDSDNLEDVGCCGPLKYNVSPDDGLCMKLLYAIYYIFGAPLRLLFILTIPDCRRPGCWAKVYWITFIMSCVWLSALSYLMVWVITVTGYTIGIPDTVMGLTLIAAGSSVPDVIASVIVVKEGEGDMALSNAVGSNIFDILICMGVPWIIKICVTQSNIVVYSKGLVYSTVALLSTVAALLIATHVSKWKLTKKYGIFLLFVYVIFLVICSLLELNVFGEINLPPCDYVY